MSPSIAVDPLSTLHVSTDVPSMAITTYHPPLLEESEKLAVSSSDDSTTPTIPDGARVTTEEVKPTRDKALNEALGEYPGGFPLVFIVLAIILGIFLASLDMTIVATAIPRITDEFGGIELVSWYGAAFFMTNGGFQSSWGKAYKYFSLKYTYIAAIFVFEVGSLICALAPNSTALIVGRAICGIGAAGIGTGAYTIIGFVASPRKRPTFTGFVGLSHGVASILGPLVGGVFSDHVTWRWCFWINLPIGGLSALTILFFFQPPDSAKPVIATGTEKFLQMDPVGVVIIMGGILCYLLALQYGGETNSHWDKGKVIGLVIGFTLLSVTFVTWEYYQGERAMLVPRIIKQRAIGISAIFTMFFSGSYFLVIYYLPIYFQSVHGTTPTMSGVYNLPLILVVAVAMISSGIMISKWNLAVPLKILGSIIAVIGAALFYTFELDSNLGRIIGYQIIGGIGWGLAFQVPIIISQGSADPQDISCVTAMVLFFMNLGGMMFVSAGQCGFVNMMISTLLSTAPAIDPDKVILTGATRIREMFSADAVPLIVASYTQGVRVAFSIAIGGAGVAFVVALFYPQTMIFERRPTADVEATDGSKDDGRNEIDKGKTETSA
ncbi:related to major facilitator (MFS1) transporter [Cephalotrichum gorgonifer]|uniref:Related to major facilitator (MFS1) transporter n=1 Tax=Cephalotrichum gorgonifer TaxID=2041049 RepID=A0AAE8T0P3_9PEZI|nr:related to major facilitator (MFS1) transporter [Cephalotrichum gorgonifer]